ncbi:MAG TPA: Uma2 family endonuclease [Thermoanaerobaculia bacterium]|jgi:Uma2 family endonuclease|nr:Uma2 family endonuclease [Thermoanaerobaculia bacterium]
MATASVIHRWSREEYEHMAEAGVFGDRRVELVEGTVYDMTPQSRRHAAALRRTRKALEAVCPRGWDVDVQMPFGAGEDSLPEPDLAIIPEDPAGHAAAHPQAAALIVEVSDSSLRYDREHKTPLYARAGIPETWLVNLLQNRVEVYREPVDGLYRVRLSCGPGDRIAPLFRPDAAIPVASLLPPR